MRTLMTGLLLSAVAAAQLENARIGAVDFYALGDGVDAPALRAALTVRPGDRLEWPATRNKIRNELAAATGREFTHFAPVCCDTSGRWILYIGFADPGAGQANERARPARADLRLPAELMALYDEFMARLPESLKYQAGRPDDYSKGYSLSLWPPMRDVQNRMREAALASETGILAVLTEAASDRDRVAAAHLTGYTRQSTEQIRALVDASRDPNETVRNNATRALGVLAATAAIARQIPAEPFISKLNSHIWSDRNKALMLLRSLTESRDPKLLAKLREQAVPALKEMARWQFAAHASGPILILGRIAGIPESELAPLAAAGNSGPVLAVIERQRNR